MENYIYLMHLLAVSVTKNHCVQSREELPYSLSCNYSFFFYGIASDSFRPELEGFDSNILRLRFPY